MINNLKKIFRHITGEQSVLNEHFITAAERSDLHELNKLLREGADINAVNRQENTALHISCKTGATVCIEWLIQNGADVTAKDLYQQTVLHKIAIHDRSECIGQFSELMFWLAEKKDIDGYTALNRAAENNNFRVIKKLLQYDVDCNTKNNDGFTPLHYAAINGFKVSAELLIQAGANIDALDDFKRSAIDLARINMRLDVVDYLENYKKAKSELSDLNATIEDNGISESVRISF